MRRAPLHAMLHPSFIANAGPIMKHERRLRSSHFIALDRVPCQVCQHDIPLSEAVVSEATDYVVYFCGLECYERWRASNACSIQVSPSGELSQEI